MPVTEMHPRGRTCRRLDTARTWIIKNSIFVGPNIEKNCGFKLLSNQRTHWCDCIEELMKTKNVNPNKDSESSASLNQSRFTF